MKDPAPAVKKRGMALGNPPFCAIPLIEAGYYLAMEAIASIIIASKVSTSIEP